MKRIHFRSALETATQSGGVLKKMHRHVVQAFWQVRLNVSSQQARLLLTADFLWPLTGFWCWIDAWLSLYGHNTSCVLLTVFICKIKAISLKFQNCQIVFCRFYWIVWRARPLKSVSMTLVFIVILCKDTSISLMPKPVADHKWNEWKQ